MSKYEKFSKEELLALVEKQDNELILKKYGLVWDSEREPEQVVLDCEHNLPVLKRVKGKEIKTDDNQDNILIEGDNYHALTVLNYTHQEKIDVIYIDPPYNTEQDGFIYNDKKVDINDGFRHSKWLNFMEKRLKLAKNLIKNDGVIFISIDDNEYSQLKLLCDKIFNEDNFIANLIWEKVRIRKNSALYFTENHDYILTIAKKKQNNINDNGWVRNLLNREQNNYTNPDNDINGPWIRGSVTANNPYSANYKIIKPNGVILERPKNSYWRYSEDSFNKFVQENRVIWGKNNSYPMIKKYLKDAKDGLVPKSILDFFEYGGNPDGANELKEIFDGEKVFTNPKPSKLIKKLINFHVNKNAVILDFFAGSGTTGHAVLELNKEDGGKRKFILCTNNENNICEKITYPRICNVIKGYKFNGKDKKVLMEQKLTFSQFKNINEILKEVNKVIEENKSKFDEIEKNFEDNTIKIIGVKNINSKKEGLDGNLQYFKTDLIKQTKNKDQMRLDLTQKCSEMLCVKENIFNLKIEKEDYKIFSSNKNDKFLGVYFNLFDESFGDFLKEIKKLKGEKKIYMFSIDGRVDRKLFSGVENFEIEEIPQKIIEVYKQLIKMNIPVKVDTIFLEFEKANKKIIEENEKDEGARMLRIVIEKTIQKIAQKNNISILKENHKEEKIAVLNDKLKENKVFNQVQWEENKTYLTIGNNAAHGDYDEYSLVQVKNFYKHIQSLFNDFGI